MSNQPQKNAERGKQEFLKTVVLPVEDAFCVEWGRPGMKREGQLVGLSLLDVKLVEETANRDALRESRDARRDQAISEGVCGPLPRRESPSRGE